MILRVFWWLALLPVQMVLLGLFCLCELVRLPLALFRSLLPSKSDLDSPGRDPSRLSCSFVILNWNGRHLLKESLSPLKRALQSAGPGHQVIVVDNGSTDDSCQWVKENHPWVELLKLDRNYGFGEGNNRGVELAKNPIVVLLNNDMVVAEDFLTPLLQPFSDPLVFAVSSQIHFPESKRREETGITRGRWQRGYLHLEHSTVEEAYLRRSGLPILWAGGGSSAFDRERFLALGGFSSLFSPCYLEDTDLSYRAWRRGWKVVAAAKSSVLHKHRSSSRTRFQDQELQNLIEQRKLWYVWKNFQLRTLTHHFFWLPINFGQYLRPSNFFGALTKIPAVLWARVLEPMRAVNDTTLFRWVESPVQYLNHFQKKRSHPAPDQRPLSILIVSAYLPHLGRHGGAGRVFQLLKRVGRQHDVSLICFVETKEELEQVQQVEPYCRRIETVLRRDYVPLSFFPYEPFEEFNCPPFRKQLERLLAEEDFDLVHFEWTQMAAYSDLFVHVPKLVTEIEVNYAAHHSMVRVETKLLRKIKRYYDTLQTLHREIEACRKVDKVVCVTGADADFLKGYVEPEKLEVVNTGVDTSYFTPKEKGAEDPNALVYVGAFRHEPNVDAMLFFYREVLPTIVEQRPQTQLYIVGSSPPPVIRELGKNQNVTVTGFVEEIRDYYRQAAVVVVPLRTGVGIRGKILEGWAAGCAMVATSLACLGIRAVHGENILICDEPELFAHWTLALLRNPEHRVRLGLAGRETAVRYYEWDQLGMQMSDIYRSLFQPARKTTPILNGTPTPFQEPGT